MLKRFFVGVVVVLLIATLGCVWQGRPKAEGKALLSEALGLGAVEKVTRLRFDGSLISPNGAVGENKEKWANVTIQGEAAYYGTITAIRESREELASRSLRAIEFALAHQLANGTFEKSEPKDNLRFAVFGLAALSFLQNSGFAEQLSDRIGNAITKLHSTATWIKDNAPFDASTRNSNIKAALAFVLLKTGHHNKDKALVESGENYLQQVLASQDASGYYVEYDVNGNAGWDSSYQMVTAYLLYFTYLSNVSPAHSATIKKSLQSSFNWEKARINPNGRIEDKGNRRTTNEPSLSPEGKGINYIEAALSLAYLHSLGIKEAAQLAGTVAEYAEHYYKKPKPTITADFLE